MLNNEVIYTRGGEEAKEYFDKDPDAFKLVMLDSPKASGTKYFHVSNDPIGTACNMASATIVSNHCGISPQARRFLAKLPPAHDASIYPMEPLEPEGLEQQGQELEQGEEQQQGPGGHDYQEQEEREEQGA
ncbi:hypothetical protein SELMODRAFT_443633 [Selaginella moellendorffii]|uniref:Uncharacterized protein n=1 Tax=Selaginella moellendorffii TaxID=88036 RepID=D8S338_SELML|nr:hypothetical protein SELMODRAFT_443633 [Selaginella moellendorffii]